MDRLERLMKAVEDLQEHSRVLQEQLQALEALKDDKAEHVAVMEQVHAVLERHNRYLMGELERRSAEPWRVTKP